MAANHLNKIIMRKSLNNIRRTGLIMKLTATHKLKMMSGLRLINPF
jgi:hypothetical protein